MQGRIRGLANPLIETAVAEILARHHRLKLFSLGLYSDLNQVIISDPRSSATGEHLLEPGPGCPFLKTDQDM